MLNPKVVKMPAGCNDPGIEAITSRPSPPGYYNQCDMLVTLRIPGSLQPAGIFNNFGSTSRPMRWLCLSRPQAAFGTRVRANRPAIDIILEASQLEPDQFQSERLTHRSNLTSVYVVDRRTLPATSLGAVRVVNGLRLPPNGLTVATGRPLYVLGDYNTDSANRGSTNTSTSRPASLVADAITILSDSWTDANSTNAVGSRTASSTTVNAAFLTGVVETTLGHYTAAWKTSRDFLKLGDRPTYSPIMVRW